MNNKSGTSSANHKYLNCHRGIKDEAQAEDDPMFLVSTRRQGTWADSETEKALKHLIAICRSLLGELFDTILKYAVFINQALMAP